MDNEASHSPEMIANDPKKNVRILAQNLGLANENAIAIGPYSKIDNRIRLTRRANDSIKVVLQ
jgi:hypothetical protein